MVTNINAANSIFSAGEAIAFAAPDTLNVLYDGSLVSQNSYGAVFRGVPANTTFRAYECHVFGSIYSAKGAGVALVDSSGFLALDVKEGGLVSGANGVALYSSSSITNDGVIKGGQFAAISLNAFATFNLVNHGHISSSSSFAISFDSFARGNHAIENTGTIIGAIADTSSSNESTQFITNTGLIKGNVSLGKGNDTINTSAGEIRGVVTLQDGNDQYTGGNALDVVNGGQGNDTIRGGDGGDLLIGEVGNDVLYGGNGADQFFSGAGKDSILPDNGTDDFERDRIDYNELTDSGLASSAMDIIYHFVNASQGTAGKTDVIDLSGIDANANVANDQAFTLLATAGASYTGVAGQLRYVRTDNTGVANDYTILYADVNGDKRSDFALKFMGLETFKTADFVL